MITAVVKIKKPAALTLEQYQEKVSAIAGGFQTIPGLIRKNFLFSAEEGVAGGVYTWESLEAAKACYSGSWLDNIRNIFNVDPEITYYDTPVIVDNEVGEIKVKKTVT